MQAQINSFNSFKPIIEESYSEAMTIDWEPLSELPSRKYNNSTSSSPTISLSPPGPIPFPKMPPYCASLSLQELHQWTSSATNTGVQYCSRMCKLAVKIDIKIVATSCPAEAKGGNTQSNRVFLVLSSSADMQLAGSVLSD